MKASDTKVQIVNELHKPARRNFRRRRTIIKGYGDLWQIDLAEMQPYASENNGFRYILVVIDCYSKYVWTRPVKTKTAAEVAKAMDNVIEEAKYSPVNLQSDAGGEFFNRHFSALMKSYQINHYTTYTSKKAAIVERVIRTLKNWIYKEFSIRGKYMWLDILASITKKYNSKVHSTTHRKPCDITPTTALTAYNYTKIALKPKFHIGDIVRISKYKGVFDKGYMANFSTELFKIRKINITNPITYYLEDMDGQPIIGGFYEIELQKTKYPDVYLVEKILKRRGDKLFVKWLGFPKEKCSWIQEKDII